MNRSHLKLPSFFDHTFGIVASSVAINCTALAFPLLMMQMYDRIIPHQSLTTLSLFVMAVVIAALTEVFLRYSRSYLTIWTSSKFEHVAMKEVASRLMQEPLHSYELRGNGAITQIFRSISLLKSHQSGQTFQQLLDLPFSIFYIGIVYAMSLPMGLALSATVLLYGLFVFITNASFSSWVKANQEADLRRGNFLNEILRHIHTVKSMTMEALMLRRHDRLQGQCAKSVTDLSFSIERGNAMGIIFSALASVSLVGLGAWLSIDHRLTSGELAACLMLGMRALSPVQRFGTIWIRYQQDRHHKRELLKILDQPEWVFHPDSSSQDEAMTPLGISAKGLEYQFPRSTISNLGPIDLHVEPGEVVQLQLHSGQGRTLCFQLFSGILKPSAGNLTFSSKQAHFTVKDLSQDDIAYVSAASHFFEGTLLQNLTRFETKNQTQALEFADSTGLADFVAQLPKGWQTPVGHMVTDTLPAAFRLRIALLCALFKKPGIIFLDDPGSLLDEAGEELLLRYLSSIRGKVTLIFCTDRTVWNQLEPRTIDLSSVRLQISKTSDASAFATSKGFLTNLPSAELTSSSDQSDDDLSSKQNLALMSQFRKVNANLHVTQVLMKELKIESTAREVAESAPYFYDELSFSQLFDTLARLGYEGKLIENHRGILPWVELPCLVQPHHGSPYVITDRVEGEFTISERPGLTRRVSARDIQGKLYGFKHIKPLTSKSKDWVMDILASFKSQIILATLCSLTGGVLLAASPMLTMQIYSTVIPTGSMLSLGTYVGGAALCLMLSYLFMRQRMRMMSYIAGRIDFMFGTAIFERILKISPAMSEGASVASQMARLRSFEVIRDFFTTPLATILLELPVSLAFLMILAWVNPYALMVVMAATAAYAALYFFQNKHIQKITKLVIGASTERSRFLNECFANMRPIRLMHGEEDWLKRFFKLSSNATMSNFEVELQTALSVSISNFIMQMSGLAVVAISAPLVINQTLSSGALIASMFLIWRVLSPLQAIYTNITRITRLRSATSQINSLMQIETESRLNEPANYLKVNQGDIQFSRISYRYPDSTDSALGGVTFAVQSGELVCICGGNGDGKTTLLKLLLRMLPIQNGAILLDGLDIRQFNPSRLRRYFGYASQESQFFRATITQNLRLARPDAGDAEIELILKKLNAWDELSTLKDGLNTRLGDNTQVLGTGLMQKLNLARAFITDAPCVLMDEPTSHLSPEDLSAFVELIKSLQGRKTILMITRQAELLNLADQKFLLKNGNLSLIAS